MNQGVLKYISMIILISLTICSLFFLKSGICNTNIQGESLIGGFCAAEHASAPSLFENTDSHVAILLKRTTNTLFIALVVIFAAITVIKKINVSYWKLFSNPIFIRYGPYKKRFLPNMVATHGM